MIRSLPLAVQLLLTFVGLTVGATSALTVLASRTSRTHHEDEARSNVRFAAEAHAQAVTQLFELRQQKGQALLNAGRSLCGDPTPSGRLAWAEGCVRTMLTEFRESERALGVLLTVRGRRVSRLGLHVAAGQPDPERLAQLVRLPDGTLNYVVHSTLGDAALRVQYGHEEVAELFDDPLGVGLTAEVFIVDESGGFLIPPRYASADALPNPTVEPSRSCPSDPEEVVSPDYRGVRTIHGVHPLQALGACVDVHIPYDEALAPAAQLQRALVTSSVACSILGVLLSLLAAQQISAPVRRLARSAHELQGGHFERPIPLAGPSEVRDLGRAFNAMANDLAELVAREQAARRAAEEANRSKDEFLATVSHELRTPLTAILGWTHMLRSGKLSAERARHALEVVERNAHSQRQLVEDLIDVSRIAANRLRLVREPVPIASVIESALDVVRPQALLKGLDLEVAIDQADAMVLGDRQRLTQIVWNLVWNAVKFTRAPGRVRVSLDGDDQQLRLAVSDTGIGIPPAFLPYVFDWFRQLDDPRQSGLGLGLGIVRHLVQLHGGTVRAESRGEGHGATFIVTLSRHRALEGLAPRTAGATADSEAPLLRSVRVLVVEDDEDTREVLCATLEAAGARVAAVSNATDARHELAARPVDVLISDIRMPEEDGYSLIRSLREKCVTIPAIALTAYARSTDADTARATGFQMHLAKPVDAGQLVEAVATLAEHRQTAC